MSLNLSVKKDDLNSDSIITVICQLVSFLIANIVKTEKEWNDWGYPFLQIVFASQFPNDEERIHLLQDFQQQFFPLIGHGIALWIEESIHNTNQASEALEYHQNQGIDDYVFISSLEEKLTKVLSKYLLYQSKDIENHLILFFTNFYQYLEKIEHYYDSRERNIARKVCQMLNLSAHQFSDLERELLFSKGEDNNSSSNTLFLSESVPDDVRQYPKEEKGNDLFLTLFHQHSHAIPRESLLVSYRMWRVAFIAAGGGAMVGIAGFIAAPSIVSTVIPVLCNAATFTQLSVTLDTFISYVGLLTYPLLPSIFTTYGATVAGTVMMKRTAAIKDFELLPLHIHQDEKYHNLETLYSQKDKTGVPIFILVNGHVEKNIDARVMWGANGTDVVISEQTVTTAVTKKTSSSNVLAESEEIVVAKESRVNVNYHYPGIISSTVQELQVELLEESKLIAETIVQSIHGISSQEKESLAIARTESYETVEKDNQNKEEEKEEEVEERELHEWEELEFSYSKGWWKEILPYGEEYVLSWENDLLSHLTESFLSMIKHKISSKIIGHLKDFFYQQITPLHAIKKSIGLPNLALAKIKQLDDVWIIAMDRALQGGKLLAKILLKQFLQRRGSDNNQQTASAAKAVLRPITLVGYGMGARLIYHCLDALLEESKQLEGGEEAIKGIIENVVLIGAPVKIDILKFQSFRNIISSRFINCYSRYDWILALLYRSKAYEFLIAGLYPIYLPGQVPEPTMIANQKQQLFIERVEANEEDYSLSLNVSVMDASQIEKLEEKEAKLLAEKEKELKARLKMIENENKVIENYDVTDLVYLQTDYPKVLPAIMKLINLQQI